MRFSLLTFSLVAFIPCCKPPQNSNLAHKAQMFVNETYAWQWARPSSEQAYLASLGISPNKTEEQLKVEKHLQERLNAMFDRVQEKYKAHMSNVPRPRVIVVNDGTVNAWVKPLVSCIPINFILDKKIAGTISGHLSYDLPARKVSYTDNKFCAAEASQPNLNEFVGWWNRKESLCKLNASGNAVVLGANCLDVSNIEAVQAKGVSRISAIEMPVSAPYVFVGSGMLHKAANEAQLMSVLAHELTHYLKSHFTSEDTSKYDYFYDDAAHSEDGYPRPSAELAGIGKELKAFSQEIAYSKVEGQKFPSSTFRANTGFVANPKAEKICAGNSQCISACGKMESFAQTNEFKRLAEVPPIFMASPPRFPYAPLEANLLLTFQQFENAVEQCSQFVEFNKPEVEGSVLRENLLSALSSQTREEFASQIAHAKTRLDLLRIITNIENNSIRKKAELYARSVDLRMGWYTVEQEADDMGLEILNLMGGNVEDMIAFKIAFSNEKPTEDVNELSATDCLNLRAQGWQVGGKSAAIPIGTIADNHHSSCYRIFNIDREQKIHGYKPATYKLLNAQEWKSLVQGTMPPKK